MSAAWLAPWLSSPWWRHGPKDETWPVVLTKSEVMACGICSLHTLWIALSRRTTILAIRNVASSASMFSAFLRLVPCEITVQFPVMLDNCPSQSHASWDGAKKLRGSCQSMVQCYLQWQYLCTICLMLYCIAICIHVCISLYPSLPSFRVPQVTTADRKIEEYKNYTAYTCVQWHQSILWQERSISMSTCFHTSRGRPAGRGTSATPSSML